MNTSVPPPNVRPDANGFCKLTTMVINLKSTRHALVGMSFVRRMFFYWRIRKQQIRWVVPKHEPLWDPHGLGWSCVDTSILLPHHVTVVEVQWGNLSPRNTRYATALICLLHFSWCTSGNVPITLKARKGDKSGEKCLEVPPYFSKWDTIQSFPKVAVSETEVVSLSEADKKSSQK